MSGPLSGLKIIEMAGIGPAPFTAMLLADLGAEVVRVERPNQTDPLGMPPAFDILLRGRQRLVANLKDPADQDCLWSLIEGADALIEGFRPGVMERLGFGPDAVQAHNPKLVYGRMTGWGQSGPYADRAGHDLNYLGLTGAVMSFGPADGPPWPPLNLAADFGGGGMYLAFGLLAAIMEARETGHGQVVDAAMVDGASLLMSMAYGMNSAGFTPNPRGGNLLDGGAPFYACYECRDGGYLTVCPLEPQFYAAFVERADLAEHPAFARQYDQKSWPAMKTALTEMFMTQDRDYWANLFSDVDACVFPALELDEVKDHPHNSARQTHANIDGALHPMPGPRFGADNIPDAAPVQTDHTKISEFKGW
ncbi:MAG: CaiB/BaiF CoA transferase family protein [Pikeienuella sp.]